jgi:hypothetical protein
LGRYKTTRDMPDRLRYHLDFKVKLKPGDRLELPLFHVCKENTLMTYLENEEIVETEKCEVFEKKIIYSFYGASKYKTGKKWKNASRGDKSACLILDIKYCSGITNIYPFDTGIASGKVNDVREYIHRWEELKTKLDLGIERDRINKFILHCFSSLEDYINGNYVEKKKYELEAKLTAPDSLSHVSDVHKIILDQSIADERRYCMEVLLGETHPLKPDLVKGVIVSHSLLEKKDVPFKEMLIKYRMKRFILNNSLFYPSSLDVNEKIEEEMKRISIDLSIKMLANK